MSETSQMMKPFILRYWQYDPSYSPESTKLLAASSLPENDRTIQIATVSLESNL